MASREEILKKAVEKGVKNFGDVEAAWDFLLSEHVNNIMKSIEERHKGGVVRAIFGDICAERKTGNKKINMCKSTLDYATMKKTYNPVGPKYIQIAEHPVELDAEVDLSGLEEDGRYPEIAGAFKVEDFLEHEYDEADMERTLKAMYPTMTTVLHIEGKAEYYALDSHPTMNGAVPDEDREPDELVVEEMLMGELYMRISQLDVVKDNPGLGPTFGGRVIIGTQESLDAGKGYMMWMAKPFSGDIRKDLRDMGFNVINQLCQAKKDPEKFLEDLKNNKRMLVRHPEEHFEKVVAVQREFNAQLDAACEALELEKTWRDMPPDLPGVLPFSGY